jgi:sugar transferase (PEP-CTERM/EpsH1 system associated)
VRILMLSPFAPYPPEDGGRQRIFEIARRLALRHDVRLLTLAGEHDAAHVAALRACGISVTGIPHRVSAAVRLARAVRDGSSVYAARYRSPGLARSVRYELATGRWDVVQCEFAYMAQYRPGSQEHGLAWVLDQHNVEHRLNAALMATAQGPRGRAYRLYARREHAKRRQEEIAACGRVDAVLAVSEHDAEVLRGLAPCSRVEVVPNGVDLERVRPAALAERAPGAVFVGKMDYRPNVDGVRWFCRLVLPRVRERLRGFSFTIVGADPVPSVRALERLDGVTVTGRVADPLPYLRKSTAAVVPLRAGSGTRLKILEALAAGCPVVSTTIGAEGLAVRDGTHLLLADDPEAFAGGVLSLALSEPLRRSLADAGRRLVESRYGWDSAVASLEDVYERLVRQAPDSKPAVAL